MNKILTDIFSRNAKLSSADAMTNIHDTAEIIKKLSRICPIVRSKMALLRSLTLSLGYAYSEYAL